MAYDGRGRVPSGFGSAPRRSRSKSLSGGFGSSLDYAPAYGARSVTGYTADDLASRSLPRPRLPGFSGTYSGFANQTLDTSLDDIEVPFGGSGLSRSRSRSRYSSSARRSDDGAARSRSVASVESRRPRHSDAASGLGYGPARAPSRPYYPPRLPSPASRHPRCRTQLPTTKTGGGEDGNQPPVSGVSRPCFPLSTTRRQVQAPVGRGDPPSRRRARGSRHGRTWGVMETSRVLGFGAQHRRRPTPPNMSRPSVDAHSCPARIPLARAGKALPSSVAAERANCTPAPRAATFNSADEHRAPCADLPHVLQVWLHG